MPEKAETLGDYKHGVFGQALLRSEEQMPINTVYSAF